MKKNKISEIIENIDDKYVDEATLYTGETATIRNHKLLKWGAVAACLTAVLIAGILVLPSLLKDKKDNTNSVLLGGITRPYKRGSISQSEMALIWPWEYQTIDEQYRSITLNGKEYSSRVRSISETLLGDILGSCEAEGYDIYTDQVYHQTFEAHRIQGVSDDLMIAVDMDGAYYVFMESAYNPPSTFGELLDGYSLADTLEFNRFTMYEGYIEKGYYRLENDDFIWQTLSTCQNAPFIEDDLWSPGDKNYISFTATSEALGIYKKVFYISEDGYISTNIFEYGYTYHIGEKAAGQIISDVMENATESEFEPYGYSLVGTLTEICDGYILVDDSILCSKASDGMIFKVPTDDLRVSRYIDFQTIDIGDTVIIQFTDNIDVEAGNLVTGVYNISDVIISDGDVIVLE